MSVSGSELGPAGFYLVGEQLTHLGNIVDQTSSTGKNWDVECRRAPESAGWGGKKERKRNLISKRNWTELSSTLQGCTATATCRPAGKSHSSVLFIPLHYFLNS